jgi:hypothetical protein
LMMPAGYGCVGNGFWEVWDDNFNSHEIVLAQAVETVYPTLKHES